MGASFVTDKVLVVVAHQDDEILLCGGTMAKHLAAWEPVHVLILSSGVGSRGSGSEQERAEALLNASKVIGYSAEVLDFPDQQLDTVPILVITKEIEKRVQDLKPTLVYTHWHGDMNKDHRIVSEATKVACRPQPGCSVKILLMGEVCSNTEWAGGFNPNYFVGINELWEKKMDALKCYVSEIRLWPHARSNGAILALAEHRGATVGMELAEAFELVRTIR